MLNGCGPLFYRAASDTNVSVVRSERARWAALNGHTELEHRAPGGEKGQLQALTAVCSSWPLVKLGTTLLAFPHLQGGPFRLTAGSNAISLAPGVPIFFAISRFPRNCVIRAVFLANAVSVQACAPGISGNMDMPCDIPRDRVLVPIAIRRAEFGAMDCGSSHSRTVRESDLHSRLWRGCHEWKPLDHSRGTAILRRGTGRVLRHRTAVGLTRLAQREESIRRGPAVALQRPWTRASCACAYRHATPGEYYGWQALHGHCCPLVVLFCGWVELQAYVRDCSSFLCGESRVLDCWLPRMDDARSMGSGLGRKSRKQLESDLRAPAGGVRDLVRLHAARIVESYPQRKRRLVWSLHLSHDYRESVRPVRSCWIGPGVVCHAWSHDTARVSLVAVHRAAGPHAKAQPAHSSLVDPRPCCAAVRAVACHADE